MFITGLQLGAASRVTLARNLDIVFAFIFQLTVFGEAANAFSILGALLITVCSLLSFYKSYTESISPNSDNDNDLTIHDQHEYKSPRSAGDECARDQEEDSNL